MAPSGDGTLRAHGRGCAISCTRAVVAPLSFVYLPVLCSHRAKSACARVTLAARTCLSSRTSLHRREWLGRLCVRVDDVLLVAIPSWFSPTSHVPCLSPLPPSVSVSARVCIDTEAPPLPCAQRENVACVGGGGYVAAEICWPLSPQRMLPGCVLPSPFRFRFIMSTYTRIYRIYICVCGCGWGGEYVALHMHGPWSPSPLPLPLPLSQVPPPQGTSRL